MREVKVGVYDLGGESVTVALREGFGGDFSTRTPEREMTLIRIGAGTKDAEWAGAVGILLHEATEFVYMRMGLRYRPDPDYAFDNGAYLFIANHTQYAEICARVGLFLSHCLPDLSGAWKKWQKKERKRPSD